MLPRTAIALLTATLFPCFAAAEDEAVNSSDYFDWAAKHGLVGVFGQPEADLDGDGITNLMAYAFGLDPLADPDKVFQILPSLVFLGDPPEPTLSFVLPPRIPADVTYIVEAITEDGERVTLATKTGRTPWRGDAKIAKHFHRDGSTEITVYPPLDLELPDHGRPLRLRVEFAP